MEENDEPLVQPLLRHLVRLSLGVACQVWAIATAGADLPFLLICEWLIDWGGGIQSAMPASGECRMQRVTITLDDALMDELDAIIAARGYQNRSEAIRDLARAGIREAAEDIVKSATAWLLWSTPTTTRRGNCPSG